MSVDNVTYFASVTVGSTVTTTNVFRLKHPNTRNEVVTAVDNSTITTKFATYQKPYIRNGWSPRNAYKLTPNNTFGERAIVAP